MINIIKKIEAIFQVDNPKQNQKQEVPDYFSMGL